MNFGRFLLLRGKKRNKSMAHNGKKKRNKMKHLRGHSGKQEGMVTIFSWAQQGGKRRVVAQQGDFD